MLLFSFFIVLVSLVALFYRFMSNVLAGFVAVVAVAAVVVVVVVVAAAVVVVVVVVVAAAVVALFKA